MFKTIVIIGAGTMGEAFARMCIAHGLKTYVVDLSNEALKHCIKNVVSQHPEREVLIQGSNHIPKIEQDCIIIEAVSENIAIKKNVLSQLEDNVSENSIIMTNTSGLSIDKLAIGLKRPSQFIGAHFFNPADIIPGVEIICHAHTSQNVINSVFDFLIFLEKIPSLIKKSVPGFVVNRVQHAMMRECFHLVEEDVIDIEQLDSLIKNTLGIRLAVNGPFLQRDLNGLDTHQSIVNYLYPDLSNQTTSFQILNKKVNQGYLGVKSHQGFYSWTKDKIKITKDKEAILLKKIAFLSKE
jgi:3-hydroxybutyryl-CoA dehydrogenase